MTLVDEKMFNCDQDEKKVSNSQFLHNVCHSVDFNIMVTVYVPTAVTL
jgi:hypothetical protein